MTRRLLLLAYYFPPYGGGYSIRIGKLAKYLPRAGWEVEVVSVNPRYYTANVIVGDSSEIDEKYVRRTDSYEKALGVAGRSLPDSPAGGGRSLIRRALQAMKHFVLIPDRQLLWLPMAAAQAEMLHKERPYDAILVTCPPMSTLLGALFLGRRLQLPLLLDLRDDWTDTATFNALPAWRRRIEKWLERMAVKRVDYLVVPTKRSLERYLALFPSHHDRITLIPNGFDAEDFPEALFSSRPNEEKRCLSLVHLGNLPSSRSPLTLLEAIQLLRETDPEVAAKLCFTQVGFVDGRFRPFFDSLIASGHARLLAPVAHAEAIKMMAQAGALLLLPSQETPTAVPGKLYEYLATRHPIVALVEAGATEDLLRQLGARWLANVHDVNQITCMLRALVEQFTQEPSNLRTMIAKDALPHFDRRRHAEQFARLLERVIVVRSPAGHRVLRRN
jgi:glycosyltransferase involved in cell wall biosynthesis